MNTVTHKRFAHTHTQVNPQSQNVRTHIHTHTDTHTHSQTRYLNAVEILLSFILRKHKNILYIVHYYPVQPPLSPTHKDLCTHKAHYIYIIYLYSTPCKHTHTNTTAHIHIYVMYIVYINI